MAWSIPLNARAITTYAMVNEINISNDRNVRLSMKTPACVSSSTPPPTSTPDPAPTGDLKTAVGQAMDLLGRGQPALALEQAEEILRLFPGEANGLFVIAAAERALGRGEDAIGGLRRLLARTPDFALAQQELGFALADAETVS